MNDFVIMILTGISIFIPNNNYHNMIYKDLPKNKLFNK